MAGGGGVLVDGAEDEEEDDEGDHCHCGCSREGRVPDDLDVGEERRGSEDLLEIAEDGDESNGHEESQDVVDQCGGNHGLWELSSCVLQFLGHVDRGVCTDQGDDGSTDSHETGGADAAPSGVILEVREDFLRAGTGAHGQQDDEEGDEAEYVGCEDSGFDTRESPGEEDIE